MTEQQQSIQSAQVIQHPKIKRTRLRADIQAVEQMRKKLELTEYEFSKALGYERTSYKEMLRRADIPRVVQLAAEALVRRQARGAGDQLLLLRITRGVASVQSIEDPQTLLLNGTRYLLVEQPK